MRLFKLLLLLILTQAAFSQEIPKDSIALKEKTGLNYKSLIIPSAFLAYGILGINGEEIKEIDYSLQEKISKNERPPLVIDDYLQYSPIISVYALDFLGIKSKNNFKDRSILIASSILFGGTITKILKNNRLVIRPNRKNKFSFPSGHTTVAFIGAEFMYQEYKDVSIWYGVTAYAVAGATGFLRIYNDHHWPSDVIAGAGLGILSTKLIYFIYPKIKKAFSNKESRVSTNIVPFFGDRQAGVGLSVNW